MLAAVFQTFLVFCLFLSFLSGCAPHTPPKRQAPEPSGTLLKPELRVGTSPDYLPLSHKHAALGLVGVEIDFARELGKGLGKTIVFVEMPFAELIDALLEERIDIIMSGMSITNERAERISFTDPYARVGQMALVRAKDRLAFPDVKSFAAVTSSIGFVRQTTGEMAAKAFFPRAVLASQPTIEDGIAALRGGQITVFIHDAPTVWRIAGNPAEKELAGLYWPLTKEPLAWGVRKDDEPLRFALNRQLERWRTSGTLNQILSRWVAVRIW